MKNLFNNIITFFISLKTAIAALVLLFVLVVFCTLEQVDLGTWGAVDKYFRSFFLWAPVPGTGWSAPVFPSGGFAGLLLLLNLVFSAVYRLPRRRNKSGIWLIHLGLVLLILGEFVTGAFSVETQMAIEEGQSRNYVESPRKSELYLLDATDPTVDEVFAVPESLLRRGRVLEHPAWPFRVRVVDFFQNAAIGARPLSEVLPPSRADRGVGRSLVLQPMPETPRDDRRDLPAAYLEILSDSGSLGIWLAAVEIDGAQEFTHAGRVFRLGMRFAREYLPYTMTLKDFKHDVYPGTDIPKNFSSSVRMTNPETGENRDVLIYMNHPFRYLGKTYYQSSFGKNDTLSVFQVVKNPGWALPYVSFILMALGLMYHFILHLIGFNPAAEDA